MPRFTLFNLPGCPYCVRVQRAANRLGIELDVVDVHHDPSAMQRLLSWRGRTTVPVLEIPGANGPSLMAESADIVAYLETLR